MRYARSADKRKGTLSLPGSKALYNLGIQPSSIALLISKLAKTLASCMYLPASKCQHQEISPSHHILPVHNFVGEIALAVTCWLVDFNMGNINDSLSSYPHGIF